MFFKLIFKIVSVINSNKRPGEIAAGFSFGILLALVPSGNLLWILLFTLGFFTRLNISTALITMVIGKLAVPLIDNLVHSLGRWILTMDNLVNIFTAMNNAPVVPFTKFNNTIVMGSFVLGILLLIPTWILFRLLITLYRNKLRDRIKNSKFAKWFSRLPLVAKISRFMVRAGKLSSGNV